MVLHISVFDAAVKGFGGVGNVVKAARVLDIYNALSWKLAIWSYASVCTQIMGIRQERRIKS